MFSFQKKHKIFRSKVWLIYRGKKAINRNFLRPRLYIYSTITLNKLLYVCEPKETMSKELKKSEDNVSPNNRMIMKREKEIAAEKYIK